MVPKEYYMYIYIYCVYIYTVVCQCVSVVFYIVRLPLSAVRSQ